MPHWRCRGAAVSYLGRSRERRRAVLSALPSLVLTSKIHNGQSPLRNEAGSKRVILYRRKAATVLTGRGELELAFPRISTTLPPETPSVDGEVFIPPSLDHVREVSVEQGVNQRHLYDEDGTDGGGPANVSSANRRVGVPYGRHGNGEGTSTSLTASGVNTPRPGPNHPATALSNPLITMLFGRRIPPLTDKSLYRAPAKTPGSAHRLWTGV
ncbi:hypothetical protein Bbelb_225270 [Branchiostoma belcheri]|nr:hypothetical protein Bbelb_225270 [Branchiostoma belcheri]